MQTNDALAAFAATVLSYGNSDAVEVFGDRKVFLCTVLEAWFMDSPKTAPTRAQFSAQLVEAHRARLLSLSRADFVQAMDPGLVEFSEVRTNGATFHFVQVTPRR